MKKSLILFPLLFVACQPKEQSEPPPPASPSQKEAAQKDTATTIPTPESFVGLPLKEAEEKAKKADIPFRIVKQDGQDFPVTRDYRPERLNFTVENGIVTEVKNG